MRQNSKSDSRLSGQGWNPERQLAPCVSHGPAVSLALVPPSRQWPGPKTPGRIRLRRTSTGGAIAIGHPLGAGGGMADPVGLSEPAGAGGGNRLGRRRSQFTVPHAVEHPLHRGDDLRGCRGESGLIGFGDLIGFDAGPGQHGARVGQFAGQPGQRVG